MSESLSHRMKTAVAVVAISAQLGVLVTPASAFCGFYVAKADAKLFNKASKVVLTWDDGKAAVTMASDYEGDPKEFAVVIPVPTFIARNQINVVAMNTIDHLDAFTAPRLVEYYDPDPCAPLRDYDTRFLAMAPLSSSAAAKSRAQRVTVEASYEVGEYDVQILSAQQSDGLVAWLTDNGYRMPDGAEAVLGSYIKQSMHFFVAKVNLGRMEAAGHRFLRPLQVRYETTKFMLPLRLGTVNADGPQDLIVLALTRKGRIETTNYRTVKLPTGMDVPLYVKDEFSKFYTAMFDRAVEREDRRAVFLEYAWDLGSCDPCSAEPLATAELQTLGAGWAGSGSPGFVTRLHVRYDAAHFPEDLSFMETRDRESFQGRYVLRHPWHGAANCSAGDQYWASLEPRFAREADTLADLTGWSPERIGAQMRQTGQPFTAPTDGGGFIDRVLRGGR
ncbi:MAG TPA: DUF2330 domain-containing protein [Stellaceae bacterium]|nr:DUF2330 domain-containing protein [Stellaceae bacterium]